MEMMTESLGYRVLTAGGAAEALQIIGETAIDMMLSDMVMGGGISGLELAQRVRALRPGLPILMMSGYAAAHADDPGDYTIYGSPAAAMSWRAAFGLRSIAEYDRDRPKPIHNHHRPVKSEGRFSTQSETTPPRQRMAGMGHEATLIESSALPRAQGKATGPQDPSQSARRTSKKLADGGLIRKAPIFFTFPEDARWNAGQQAVEFGVAIGEYEGVVRVPRHVFKRLLTERPTPERCVEAYYLQQTRFERVAERKLRRRRLTEDGNVEITGRDFQAPRRPPESTEPHGSSASLT